MSRDIAQLLPELFALCGQEIGVSDWKLIDQNSIDKFSIRKKEIEWKKMIPKSQTQKLI